MTEFIRLPSRILNLSYVREISFDNSNAVIRWANGDATVLEKVDIDMFYSYLERRYSLMTVPVVNYDEEPLDLSEEEIEDMFPISTPHTA